MTPEAPKSHNSSMIINPVGVAKEPIHYLKKVGHGVSWRCGLFCEVYVMVERVNALR